MKVGFTVTHLPALLHFCEVKLFFTCNVSLVITASRCGYGLKLSQEICCLTQMSWPTFCSAASGSKDTESMWTVIRDYTFTHASGKNFFTMYTYHPTLKPLPYMSHCCHKSTVWQLTWHGNTLPCWREGGGGAEMAHFAKTEPALWCHRV